MSLRLLQIVLPRRHRDELSVFLRDFPADRVWRDDVGEELQFSSVLLRAGEVEPLADKLNEQFANIDRFRIILLPVEATRPRLPEPAKPKADEGAAHEPGTEGTPAGPKPLIGRVSREELYEDIVSGASPDRLFVVMVMLSTVVAAAGLLRDSPAVIIGAMVIAPLLGPNMALALATTLGDMKLIRRGATASAVGVLIAMGMGALMGLVLDVNLESPELAARTSVGLTDLALALASGAAGALAFTAGVPGTLVGVMVAVALLPPTTAAGIYLGAGEFARSAEAFSLLAVNVVCVNLSATATFLVQGIRPDTWWARERARNATRGAIALWIVLLVALVLLLLLDDYADGVIATGIG